MIKNYNHYNLNPLTEPLAYVLSQDLETNPNAIGIDVIEEHLYEQSHDLQYVDTEELREMELIKNESNNKAIII